MRLSPTKCTSEVSAKKFLEHLVTHRRIEANLNQIKALLDMPSPNFKQEVNRF